MRQWQTVGTVALAVLALAGCARERKATVQELASDYQNTWKAMSEVMSRHYPIRQSDPRKGEIVAAEVYNDGRQGHGKTVVKAKIFPSQFGGYDVEVRATEYWEISEPYGLSDKTPRQDWRPASFNTVIEAKIRNEINDLRFQGQKPGETHKFMQLPDGEIPPLMIDKS